MNFERIFALLWSASRHAYAACARTRRMVEIAIAKYAALCAIYKAAAV